jgi:hypothetical protein
VRRALPPLSRPNGPVEGLSFREGLLSATRRAGTTRPRRLPSPAATRSGTPQRRVAFKENHATVPRSAFMRVSAQSASSRLWW